MKSNEEQQKNIMKILISPTVSILHVYFSDFAFLKENRGGSALLFPCVQIGTLTTGLILMLADRVLSSPFLILLACLSLFSEPSFPSSIGGKSSDLKEDEDVEEDEDEEEDGDKVDERCFRNLSNSFHRTVHVGGLGEGSSSGSQLTLLSALLTTSSFVASSQCSVLRLILLSFSDCCVCQNGSNLPSKSSSSADSMVWLSFERNSKSTLRAFSLGFSWSLITIEFGFIVMKSSSSSKSDEKEIRGLEICSIDLEVA